MTRIEIVEPATAGELERYYRLRWEILRAPWDQPPGSERDPLDETSTHVMAVDAARRLLGIGRLHFNSISEGQVRYMAVVPAQRGRGIGSRLLEELEQRALRLGASRIVLDARETALGFYRKRGYTPTGAGHTLFDRIAHVHMHKRMR